MKQVDFYLLSNALENATLRLASRLANQLMVGGSSLLVVTDNTLQTEQLSTMMWSFSDTSFLAHEVIGKANSSPTDTPAKVQIGAHSQVTPALLAHNYHVLINLASAVPTFSHHFKRIAEIVAPDEPAKSAARNRYQQYQGEGFDLKTHNIKL